MIIPNEYVTYTSLDSRSSVLKYIMDVLYTNQVGTFYNTFTHHIVFLLILRKNNTPTTIFKDICLTKRMLMWDA